MPLLGTLDVASVTGAPTLVDFDTEPMTVERVQILQVMYEIDSAARQSVLPAALHPTSPPTATWMFLAADDGPLGPFRLAVIRVACRAGTKLRGYLTGCFVDNPDVGEALASRWGYDCQPGDVRLAVAHDRIRGVVRRGDDVVIDAVLTAPEVISGGDIFYVADMHLAETPRGQQLVQVDPEYVFQRAARGRPELVAFDPSVCSGPPMSPVWPVSASFAVADVTWPRLRYICDPHRPALEGTTALR